MSGPQTDSLEHLVPPSPSPGSSSTLSRIDSYNVDKCRISSPSSESIDSVPLPSPVPSAPPAPPSLQQSILLRVQTMVNYFISEDQRNDVEIALSGFVKGFLLYQLPAALLERKISYVSMRRSAAIGLFVSTARLLSFFGRISLPFTEPNQDPRSRLGAFLTKYKNALIGLVCSLVALRMDGQVHRRRLFVFWLLLRALRFLLPPFPLGSTMVMCLASGQALSTWIFAPKQLSPVFLAFLNYHGAQRIADIQLFREANPPLSQHCSVVHPGMTCSEHAPVFMMAALWRALKLYAPLHLLLTLLSPKRSLLGYAEGVSRSTLFLASYCTLAWYSACKFFALFPGVTRTTLLIPTMLSGLPVLLERPSRRTELAIYVASYALDSLHNQLAVLRGKDLWMPTRSILVLATMVLFHNFQQMPTFLSSWLLRLSK